MIWYMLRTLVGARRGPWEGRGGGQDLIRGLVIVGYWGSEFWSPVHLQVVVERGWEDLSGH